jgi:RimJ/RimL family protein N-acetyltransferase
MPDRTPVFPATPLRLTGHGLVLREWTADDLDAMVSVFDNPQADAFTPVASHFDRTAAEERFARAREDRAEGRRICLAITEDGDLPLGEVLIFRDETHAPGAEIGYAIDPAYRGRGLASRAVRLMTAFGYETAGADRLVLRIDGRNKASHAVARATGFVPDGAKPVIQVVKGREQAIATWVHRRD